MSNQRLSALLNDLSDCLMAASDTSNSPQGSELLLSARMRTVLLSLLGECINAKTGASVACKPADEPINALGSYSSNTDFAAVKDKELQVLLNLVNLALQRIPKMVTDDAGATLLTIFSHILPLLAQERLR